MCMKAMFEINCINVNAKLYEITDNIQGEKFTPS